MQADENGGRVGCSSIILKDFTQDPFCTYPRSQNDAREPPPATETFLAHHGPAATALLFAIVSRRESS